MKLLTDFRDSRNLTVILFWVVAFFAFFVVILEPDLPWYLRVGEEIIRQRGIPESDLFSYTSHQAWLNHEWLSQIFLWMSYTLGGFFGVALLQAGAGLSILWALQRSERSLSKSSKAAAFLVLALGCIFLREVLSPRAQMFTDLLFAVVMVAAIAFDEGRIRFVSLVGIFFSVGVLWTQFHGGAPHPVVVAALLAIKRRDKESGAVLGVAAIATLIGPFGVKVHQHYLEAHASLPQISEWQPITSLWAKTSHGYFVGTLLFILMAWWIRAVIIKSERRMRLEDLLLAFFTIAAIVFVRFLTEAMIVAVLVLAKFLPEVFRPGWLSRARSAFAGALMIIGAIIYSPRELGWGLSESRFPQGMIDFVRNNRLQGPLFNSYNLGGYLIWALPEIPVFIDGRAFTIYSEEHFHRFIRAYDQPETFTELEREYGFRLAILQPRPTTQNLLNWMLAHGWARVYQDVGSIVLTKNQ